jgi:hypothetical protein
MSVDGPDLNPPQYGEVRDASRPILSFSWHMEGAHRAAAHRHPRAHIIQPQARPYWAVTPEGTWMAPPGQALWIPPFVHHEVYAHGTVAARMIFVDPEHAAALPSRCGTVKVSPLLSQLIERAMQYGNDYPPNGPESRLARVMLDELAGMAPSRGEASNSATSTSAPCFSRSGRTPGTYPSYPLGSRMS